MILNNISNEKTLFLINKFDIAFDFKIQIILIIKLIRNTNHLKKYEILNLELTKYGIDFKINKISDLFRTDVISFFWGV